MGDWCIQFRQRFNGATSQCKVYVKAESVYDAIDAFDAIGYVNATVNGVWRIRRDESGRARMDAEESEAE